MIRAMLAQLQIKPSMVSLWRPLSMATQAMVMFCRTFPGSVYRGVHAQTIQRIRDRSIQTGHSWAVQLPRLICSKLKLRAQ